MYSVELTAIPIYICSIIHGTHELKRMYILLLLMYFIPYVFEYSAIKFSYIDKIVD